MNARLRRNRIVSALGSLQLMIALTLLFAIASGVATFIESASGTPAARALVYDAFWFELTIGLLIVNLIALLLLRAPYKPSQYGFFLVHLSVIVILVSAGITRYFGYEGMMHIREGQSSSSIQSSRDYIQLGRDGASAGFPVLLWKAGASRTSGKLALGGEHYRVRVAEYWPRFAEELVPADSGPAALGLAVAGERGMERQQLRPGESLRAGDTQLVFHEGPLPPAGEAAPLGAIRARLGDRSASLPVSRDPAQSATIAGHRLRISEFHPDYARRNERPEPEALTNPMVRVAITGPDGTQGERVLFAFFPDFGMNHAGGEAAFAELALSYEYGRSVDLAVEGGALRARASFPLEVVDMASGAADHVLPAGEAFTPSLMTLHRAGSFSLVATLFLPHARLAPVLSDDEHAPAAARLVVEGPGGVSGEVVAIRGETARLALGGQDLRLDFGPKLIAVPYRLELDDFLLVTYPGSSNPASYESHVKLFDEAAGIDGRPVRIYMNHPLTYRGYKHFQSSYDQDQRGTVLSVNHDPGKWPTYIGYMLIGLGFLLILGKGLLARLDADRHLPRKEEA
ncbi:cytochrome c biogenesis protein ResB [bacterium]|nr:cytochrome c biogenesis protein ResB [bacterium]